MNYYINARIPLAMLPANCFLLTTNHNIRGVRRCDVQCACAGPAHSPPAGYAGVQQRAPPFPPQPPGRGAGTGYWGERWGGQRQGQG